MTPQGKSGRFSPECDSTTPLSCDWQHWQHPTHASHLIQPPHGIPTIYALSAFLFLHGQYFAKAAHPLSYSTLPATYPATRLSKDGVEALVRVGEKKW
jgi:hypothetical protein